MTSHENLDMSNENKELASLLNKDTLIHSLPPNWSTLLEVFPALKGQEQNVVFTYAPHIYMLRDMQLPPDIAVHEAVHLKQQTDISPGIWWTRYIEDPEFRLAQELEAYGAQLHFWSAYRNAIYKTEKARLARDISSSFYGNMISFGEAESALQRIVKELGPREKLVDQMQERMRQKAEAEQRGS